MRPKAVWLFELLDAKNTWGDKEECSRQDGKILHRRCGDFSGMKWISLSHTLPLASNP